MRDIKLTIEGDIEIGPNGDFAFVMDDDCLAQEVMFRMKTQRGDYTPDPLLGCSLEDFIGKPNTDETREEMRQLISNQMRYRNFLSSFDVQVSPFQENGVFCLVEFNSMEDPKRIVQIQGLVDLVKGLVFTRALSRAGG